MSFANADRWELDLIASTTENGGELDRDLLPPLGNFASESTGVTGGLCSMILFITLLGMHAASTESELVGAEWLAALTLVLFGLFLTCNGGRPALWSGLLSIAMALIAGGLFFSGTLGVSIPGLSLTLLVVWGVNVLTAGACQRRFLRTTNSVPLLERGLVKKERELALLSDNTRELLLRILALIGKVEKFREAMASTLSDHLGEMPAETSIHGIEMTTYVSCQRQTLQEAIVYVKAVRSNLDSAALVMAVIDRWKTQLAGFASVAKEKGKNDNPTAILRHLGYEEWQAWEENMPALQSRLTELTNALPELPVGVDQQIVEDETDVFATNHRLEQTGSYS